MMRTQNLEDHVLHPPLLRSQNQQRYRYHLYLFYCFRLVLRKDPLVLAMYTSLEIPLFHLCVAQEMQLLGQVLQIHLW